MSHVIGIHAIETKGTAETKGDPVDARASVLFARTITSKLNSSSASRVQTFTGNDFPDFFRPNGGILSIIFVKIHGEKSNRTVHYQRIK